MEYPIFWTLNNMATLLLCSLTVRCQIQISSWIMHPDHPCTFFTQTIFEFLNLTDAVCVCSKVPMCFTQVDGHQEAQI